MAPLSEIRVTQVAPFLHIGIDNFGPMHIISPVSRHDTINVYGLIFTCLITRAVHLEMVPDLSGEHFLLALEKFSSIRRVPQRIISDNGSNFTFVQPFLSNAIKLSDAKIKAHL